MTLVNFFYLQFQLYQIFLTQQADVRHLGNLAFNPLSCSPTFHFSGSQTCHLSGSPPTCSHVNRPSVSQSTCCPPTCSHVNSPSVSQSTCSPSYHFLACPSPSLSFSKVAFLYLHLSSSCPGNSTSHALKQICFEMELVAR